MKLCRYDDQRLGLVEENTVRDITGILDALPAHDDGDALFASLGGLQERIARCAEISAPLPLAEVRLHAPVRRPGKIVATPVNYLNHLEEVKGSAELHHGVLINQIQTAGLFLKAPSSLIGPSDRVRQRFLDRRTDHEIELAVVIGNRAEKVSVAEALACVAGYCIGLDITLRGPEERSFRKSIDTYTVLGPWLVTADEFGSPAEAALRLDVNGEPRQAANTRDLILPVAELIAFASSFYTLHPGDVLLTGTPAGVGPIRPGDVMNASIERIGAMSIAVEAAV